MMKGPFLICFSILSVVSIQAQPGWPAVNPVTRPWTRWWWMGSAVTEKGLTDNLTQLRTAGFGGVEVTPIYGVKGYEKRHVSFLSPQWLDLFDHTLSESRRLGMGVDLANATGWPFGGPWVADEDASRTLYFKSYSIQAGEKLKEKIEFLRPGLVRTANTRKPEISAIRLPFAGNPLMQEMALDQVQFPGPLKLEVLMAAGPEGQRIDVTSYVDTVGLLQWTPLTGQWQLNALFSGLHGKMVERAAPGGEGYAIDHFSKRAIRQYLHHFDSAFQGRNLEGLRGFFNDSYEVDDAQGQANWTHGMFDDFKRSRGYDLRHYLPALMGQSTPEMNSRVRYDYRSLVDEMILKNFTQEWKDWGSRQGKLLRNQSHGSPANTLDLYSVVDIPETEGGDWLRFKFATSAAHVSGKPLVAAEAATWLNEHFLSSWGDVKKALDLYFLAGVNHLIYHGTAYSPTEEPWPGWNFYAAVHFQPTHPQWNHIPTLNSYVTRVQSFLQQGRPTHEVLLYYPISDRYAAADGPILQHFDGMERNFEHTDFESISKSLQAKGIGFDFISDRQLKQVQWKNHRLQVNGMTYTLILVPEMRYLDLSTLQELERLAKAGATIAFHGGIPQELPGFSRLIERTMSKQSMLEKLDWTESLGLKHTKVGNGRWIETKSLDSMLSNMSILENPMESIGLQSHWRQTDSSLIAFVVNRQDRFIDKWVVLPHPKDTLRFFDAMTGQITKPIFRRALDGKTEVRLQLAPQASLLLVWQMTHENTKPHFYINKPVFTDTLSGSWELEFLSGGPVLPNKQLLSDLSFWTESKDSIFQSFSGTAVYRKHFTVNTARQNNWRLDLGYVQSSARVRLNGVEIGITLGPTHQLDVPAHLIEKNNVLEIEVANLMANRIAYMDRNQLPWKRFYNINMSAKKKENLKDGIFDASKWSPLPSGLNGPVCLSAFIP